MKLFDYYKYRFESGLSESQLRKVMIKDSEKIIAKEEGYIINDEGFLNFQTRLSDHGIKSLSFGEDSYPSRLRVIKDPPGILFSKGCIDYLNQMKSVAIVGTRKPSKYGLKVAYDLAKFLAINGVVVISGLAEGIDTAAHMGALAGKGHTIAVVATGVNRVYPNKNIGLSREILDSKGLIISEKPFDEPAMRYDFPFRNRLISGLSDITVIIEASHKSGSMITAKYALEQAKEIYALPGNIFSENHQGSNQLIFDGAIPLIDYKHVLESLGRQIVATIDEKEWDLDLNDFEKKIFFYIKKYNIIEIETLASLTSATQNELNEAISKLLLEEIITYNTLTSVQFIG